ncbi:MAG: IS200/IS605 family element transposase accessory protein TnpB [Cenarchaeum sp. SB0675_bin_21]|nr:IS200/IS605 family element transposase accessory protein TnpB [Cenarchaeum sp. SB0675_bin_21]
MYRSYSFRIGLTRSQARHISKIRDSQRFVYNWAVERLLTNPTLTTYDLSREFTKVRRSVSWLQTVERIYQNTAIHQARTAADVSNKYGNGELSFRARKRDNTKAVSCDVQPRFVDNRHASLPGLGVVELCEEQPYQFPHNWLYGSRSFRLVCVTPKSWGHVKSCDHIYRLHITYDVPVPERRAKTGVVAGIDRGITNPTVVCKTDHNTSNITSYDTATAFRTNRTWNDETRRTISHRNKHSNSTCKIKRKREKYNRGNANDREYAEWLLAKKICEGVDVIYVEQLNLEAMSRRGGRHKKGLNRGMRFIRHYAILRKIHTIAERLGIRVVEVSPKYTSQECSICGYTSKENRNGETFKCLRCNHMVNADGNASVNIIQRGTGMKVLAGEGMALERREMGRTRKPPVCAVPDARRRRENQACNRPKTSSAMKHLGMYAYVTRAYPGI